MNVWLVLWYQLKVCSFSMKMWLVWCSRLVYFFFILLRMCMFRFGLGNGWWQIMLQGRFSFRLILCILFLNSLCSGLISLNCMFFGRLLMLWCDLIMWVLLVLVLVDLIMLGQMVFWVRNFMFCNLVVFLLKILMKVWLMILCFFFGLVMLVRWLRNLFLVLVWIIFMFMFLVNMVIIWLFLCRCSRLLLMNMQVSWLLMVLCSSVVIIEEFMLLERLSRILEELIWVCMVVMVLLMMFEGVYSVV